MTSNQTASTNFSGFATPLDPIYAKYHGVGFSSSLVLAFTPTFILATIGLMLNASLIYVTAKCKKTLKNLFNSLISLDSLFACFFQASYIVRFFIPLLGFNYIPAKICFYFQWPATFFAAQLVTMLFIAFERLFCLLFPIWFAKRTKSWCRIYLNIVIVISLCLAILINTLIYVGIQAEFQGKDIMCNLGDYSGQLVQQVAHYVNSSLQYLTTGTYALIWLLVLKRMLMRDEIASKQNVHLLVSISLIMAILILGWIFNGSFGPLWQPFIQLSREAFFVYSIYAYINVIILASSTNAIVLYLISKEYKKCYKEAFPILGQFGFGSTPVHPLSNVSRPIQQVVQSR